MWNRLWQFSSFHSCDELKRISITHTIVWGEEKLSISAETIKRWVKEARGDVEIIKLIQVPMVGGISNTYAYGVLCVIEIEVFADGLM